MNFDSKKICQSCAMPMSDADSGTNADGTKSDVYCKFCFSSGKFAIPSLTLEQQIGRLTKIGAEKLVMPEEKARKMAESVLPGLERWKKAEDMHEF